MRVTLRASAKINLDLRVGARRADGYHDLHTIFQTLALHDTIAVESTDGPFALAGDPRLMPLDRTNLVWRAAEVLWRAAGRSGAPRGARVRVTKRIPAQAGLGGGSSDAAAALVGLSRLWRLKTRPEELAQVAATLGADVPFFLMGGTALGLGRGERLYPLIDRPKRHVVLVLPDFGVSTADAYRWLFEDRMTDPGPRTPDPEGWTPDLGRFRNDLEAPVERRHPGLQAIRAQLARAGAELARMSGSGSAVFGVFSSESRARRAATRLAGEGHRLVVTTTRARSRHESRRLA